MDFSSPATYGTLLSGLGLSVDSIGSSEHFCCRFCPWSMRFLSSSGSIGLTDDSVKMAQSLVRGATVD